MSTIPPSCIQNNRPFFTSSIIPNSLPLHSPIPTITLPHAAVYCMDRSPDEYSGYEIELFKKMMPQLGWTKDMLKWRCLTWERMMKDLVDPKPGKKRCDIAVAGMEVHPVEINNGISFSWPTYSYGFKIAVPSDFQSASGYFSYMKSFQTVVWIAIVLTAIGVGLLVYAIDWYLITRVHFNNSKTAQWKVKKFQDRDVERYFWDSLMQPMSTSDQEAFTFPSNLVVLVYGFMLLVLVTLFTANTTANITATRLQSNIQSVRDLPGKSVASWTGYTSSLKDMYGIEAVGYPWDSQEDEDRLFDLLRNGAVKALVLDNSLLEYRAATDCDIAVVGRIFEQTDSAIAFPKGFNNTELLNRINTILVTMRTNGDIQVLEDMYMAPFETICQKTSSTTDSTISFSQVAGLWIILAVAVVIALILVALRFMHVKHTKPRIITPLAQSAKNFVMKTSSLTKVLSSKRRSNGSSSEGGADDLESM